MKKMEIDQMEFFWGGTNWWKVAAGIGCGVAFVGIVTGSAIVSSGVATAGGVALGVSLGLHTCAAGLLVNSKNG